LQITGKIKNKVKSTEKYRRAKRKDIESHQREVGEPSTE
jgi:hypothetical protein